jgi:hypothetical protein
MFVPGAAAFDPAATLRDPATRPLAGEHTHKLLSRNHVLKSPRLVRTGLVSQINANAVCLVRTQFQQLGIGLSR